jgi:hypothetical protein
MKIRILAALSFLVVVAAAAKDPALPQDVQDYIQERIGCNHLAGEDYSDPSRARSMAKELHKCGFGDLNGVPVSSSSIVTIGMVEKRLRKKYRKQPIVLRAMEEARDQLP